MGRHPNNLSAVRLRPEAQPASHDEALNRLATLLKRRKLVIFFGAGLSREFPSLNPLALAPENAKLPGLRRLLIEALLEGCPDYARDQVKIALEKKPLEYLLEHFVSVVGDISLDFVDLLDPAPRGISAGPNYRHYALALIVQSDLCRNLLTVNFDTLLEKAFAELDLPGLRVPEASGAEEDAYAEAIHHPVRGARYLYKLHGSLTNRRSLLTTVETLGFGLPRYKRDLVEALLSANACLFVGYRAGDLDVFPVLMELPADCEMIWYDLEGEPSVLQALGPLLCRRSHYILVGELSEVFREILARVGISDEEILRRVGASSICDIGHRESGATGAKAEALRAFVGAVAERIELKHVAGLIAAKVLPVKQYALRSRVFRSVVRRRLPVHLQATYLAQLAEKRWNIGRLSQSTVVRRRALGSIGIARLDPAIQRKAVVEQRIRMGRDFLVLAGVGRRRLRSLRKAICFLFGAMARVHLWRGSLSAFERGRFRIMLAFQLAGWLQARAERLVVARLACRLRNGPSRVRDAILTTRMCALFAWAERRYRRCLVKWKDYSFGWNSLCMRRLAEVAMYRHESCPPEAKRLLGEADGAIEWVNWEERRSEGKEEAGVKTGSHEALRLVYEGAFDQARCCLEETYKYYEMTGHLTGKVKTRIVQAICHYEAKDREACLKTIAEIGSLLSRYQ